MNSSITGNGTSHIYYNITLTNNDMSDNLTAPIVSFTETRNQPYLNCPEDYYMSVVRFSLETPTLPVFQPQPVLGSADPDILIYQVYMTVDGETSSSASVTYTPVDTFVPPPPVPIGPNEIYNPYYNIYSHNQFIQMVNVALTDCFNNLFSSSILPTTNRPYLYWDIGSNTAVLNIAELIMTTYPSFKLWFNTPLYTLFSSFPATYTSFQRTTLTGVTTQQAYNIFIDTGVTANVSSELVGSTTVLTYNILQEYTTAPLWTPIDSIVFTTSMVPVVPELTAAPIVYNASGAFESIGSNANTTTVLTDFIVPLTTGNEYKPSINYTPNGEYRLATLFGRSAVNSIQINCFYKNRFGILIPLTLGAGCSASIKLLFRRRDFSNIVLEN